MGLVKEGDNYVVPSDILGDEDHRAIWTSQSGGFPRRYPALQMDIKIEGITKEIMQAALNQRKVRVLPSWRVMEQAIS